MANTKLVERGNRVAKIVVLRTTVTIVKNAAEIRVFPVTWGGKVLKSKLWGYWSDQMGWANERAKKLSKHYGVGILRLEGSMDAFRKEWRKFIR